MAPVLTKRLQQGLFEALSSQNRFSGSGGGSGLVGSFGLLGSATFSGGSGALTGNGSAQAATTNLNVAFMARFTHQILLLGVTDAGVTVNGNTLTTFCWLDGAQVGMSAVCSPIGGSTWSVTPFGVATVTPGSTLNPTHNATLAFQAATGVGYSYGLSSLLVLSLGGS